MLEHVLVKLLLALVLSFVAQLGAARANDVVDRGARVTHLEREVARLGAERQELARIHDEKAAGIAALKAQRASWARDRKLQTLLAESKDMASRLDRKDAELRGLAGVLLIERRALIAAIDRELAAQPPPPADRVATLERRRGQLVAAVSGPPLHVPAWTIEPDDDAEDLRFKAAALAQSERALLAEEARLDARVAYFRNQAKLARSRLRADEQDIFADEEPRRGGGGTQEARGDDDQADTPATGNHSPPTGPPEFENPPPVGPVPLTPDGRGVDLAADPSVILVDIVAAGTLDELRRAERSGDPESMARAAERASQEVEARAARVRALRLEMERRAAQLRGEK